MANFSPDARLDPGLHKHSPLDFIMLKLLEERLHQLYLQLTKHLQKASLVTDVPDVVAALYSPSCQSPGGKPSWQRAKQELKAIQDAIKRIKEGSYGLCEACQQPISHDRLLAWPHIRTCDKCHSKQVAQKLAQSLSESAYSSMH